jgi:hypothetical protein
MACVYGIHNDSNDIIYAPTWMYDLFIGDTETIEVCQYFPEMCRSLTLLPHVSLHIYKDDPQEYLRNGFEKYTCLMKGMTYNLLCGEDSEEFTTSIFTYEPESEDIVCIRNCEMELHLMKPLDMPDTPTPPPPDKPGELLPEMISSVMADLSAETPITPVTTVTAVTPVTAETAEMRRNAAAAAALKRMKSQITS